MKRNTLGSILGLATTLLVLGGIFIGVVRVKGASTLPLDEGEVVVETETTDEELIPVPEERIVLEEGEVWEMSDDYDDILNDEEEMGYRTEIAKEIAEQLPKEEEFVNPNFAINGERVLKYDDFANPFDYAKYCEENSGRPFDIDGFYTDVETYIPFEAPDTTVIEVDGILFDNEGNPLSSEDVANIGEESTEITDEENAE